MNVRLNDCAINEKNLSCLLYVLSCIWLFPFSNFILPLIFWLLLQDKYPTFYKHGKNLLNFQITWGIGLFIVWILTILFAWNSYSFFNMAFGYFAFMAIIFIAAILICIAGVFVYQNKEFEHLLAYKFIK